MILKVFFKNNFPFFVHSFLDNIKIPTTQKTSGFQICDILELNNEKQRILDTKSKESSEIKNLSSKNNLKNNDKESDAAGKQESRDNISKDESEKSPEKKKFKESASEKAEASDPKDVKSHQSSNILNDTLYHYQHLFQNPAVRPWLYMNQNGKFHIIFKSKFDSGKSQYEARAHAIK